MFDALMSSMSQVNRPFGVEERSAGFFYEYFPGIGESDYPSLLALEKTKAMLFFKLGNLLAEGGLTDAQYLGSSREA
jgi:hypothetical protein